MLLFIKYFVLYAIFTIIAALIAKKDGMSIGNPVGKSCLTVVVSGVLLAFVIPFLERIVFICFDDRGFYAWGILFEVILRIILSVVTIIIISLIFKQGVKPDVWFYVAVAVLMGVTSVLYVIYLKDVEEYTTMLSNNINNVLNIMTFRPRFQRTVSILSILPAVICAVQLVVKKHSEKI